MEQESNLDSLIDNLEQQVNLSDKEVFTKIWTSPRKVFKYIVEKKYEKYFLVLLILAGISNAFSQASSKKMGDDLSILGIILVCTIGGGIFGWFSLYIYAALLSWTGKWFKEKGKGNTNSILTVLSYAMIPSIVAMVLLIPQIGVVGTELFKTNSNFEGAGLGTALLLMITGLLQVILGVWTIVLVVFGISAIQNFSIGKSILNMLMPGLLLLAILLPIVLLITILQ